MVGSAWRGWTKADPGQKSEEVPAEIRNTLDNRRKAKHFWAFTVYNHRVKAVQVLVVKQQTIMRAVEAFGRNPKWGNPKGYDLIVEKTRTGSQARDVEYSVIPEPPAPLDPGIVALAKDVPVNLEALYGGGDPFARPEEGIAPVGVRGGRVRRLA